MKINSPAKTYGLCLAATLLISGCVNTTVRTKTETPEPNDLLNATLWMQNSVEYKANVRNVFYLAGIQLDHALKDKHWTALPDMQTHRYSNLPPAIILDCDETILDNSKYEAYLVKTGQNYSSVTWKRYVQSQVADAMPGAVEFTRYAASKGVEVFYVTNRKAASEQATFENMKALGFPMGDGQTDTLLTKGEKPEWGSAKGNRDAYIAKNYRVLLMLGDNLGDFTDKASGDPEQREEAYRQAMSHWGKTWFMLPNPAYGSFESSAFGHNYHLSTAQRREKKISVLNSWSGK